MPDDYSEAKHGAPTCDMRKRPTVNLDLDIFLTEKNFEEVFPAAVQVLLLVVKSIYILKFTL